MECRRRVARGEVRAGKLVMRGGKSRIDLDGASKLDDRLLIFMAAEIFGATVMYRSLRLFESEEQPARQAKTKTRRIRRGVKVDLMNACRFPDASDR